jgi:hypothetical protein
MIAFEAHMLLTIQSFTLVFSLMLLARNDFLLVFIFFTLFLSNNSCNAIGKFSNTILLNCVCEGVFYCVVCGCGDFVVFQTEESGSANFHSKCGIKHVIP